MWCKILWNCCISNSPSCGIYTCVSIGYSVVISWCYPTDQGLYRLRCASIWCNSDWFCHTPPLTRHTISYVKENSREAPPLCIISLGTVWGRSSEKSRTCQRLFDFVPLRIRYIWSTYPSSSIRWVLVELFFCSHSFAGSSSVLVEDTLQEGHW